MCCFHSANWIRIYDLCLCLPLCYLCINLLLHGFLHELCVRLRESNSLLKGQLPDKPSHFSLRRRKTFNSALTIRYEHLVPVSALPLWFDTDPLGFDARRLGSVRSRWRKCWVSRWSSRFSGWCSCIWSRWISTKSKGYGTSIGTGSNRSSARIPAISGSRTGSSRCSTSTTATLVYYSAYGGGSTAPGTR